MVLQLGVCELFNDTLHGYNKDSSKNIQEHYLVRFQVSKEDFMDEDELEEIEDDLDYIREKYQTVSNKGSSNIRNYNNIITNENYLTIELIDIYQLHPGEELVAIIKTVWLKIFQRKWRNYMKRKKDYIKHISHPSNIKYREIHARFPRII